MAESLLLKPEINELYFSMTNLFQLLLESDENSDTKFITIDESKPAGSTFFDSLLSIDDDEMDELFQAIKPRMKETSIEINPKDTFEIKKSHNNKAVFDLLYENYNLILKKYMPVTEKWIKAFAVSNYSESDEALLKSAVKIRLKLEDLILRYTQVCGTQQSVVLESEEDEDEFEQVDTEGVVRQLNFEQSLDGIYMSEDSEEEEEILNTKAGNKLPEIEFKSKLKKKVEVNPIQNFDKQPLQILEIIDEEQETDSHLVSWNEIQKKAETMVKSTNTKSLPKNDSTNGKDVVEQVIKSKRKAPQSSKKSRETSFSRLNKIMKKRR
ncbi:hypothetical protein BB560_001535 [Smittium megazygosporum]|uniref:Uncharacterized protein n=1 Tax=Smittium megazygosporum TaxID=133381 RepID=A0A2T9ZHD1_9FUNG|nr:hypothetical protein BB560_001535 [Smittium megazygosporum]